MSRITSMFATSPSPGGLGQMASAGESLLHSTTAPSPGEDEVGRVVECTSVEFVERLESRTSFSGLVTETLETGLEVRLKLDTTFAPPVGDSVTKLLEFSTLLRPSSLAFTFASLTVEVSEACNL